MTDPVRSDQPWLAVGNVSFSHGARRVVDQVTLRFYPGRHYIIAGPNGAGKSTLLDVLAGLKQPETGRVEVMGLPLPSYGPRRLATQLALAPQEFSLHFSFTVREVVGMGRRPYLGRWGIMSDRDEQAVDQALAQLHIEHLARRPVTALSGGERRRCIVARAIAQATPIILLDEPSAGLDISQALSLMALAKKLTAAGTLVVTVSHDLDLAAAYGDDLVFLKDGVVVAAGPMAEVFSGETLARVYETEAEVGWNAFSSSLSASFRLPS